MHEQFPTEQFIQYSEEDKVGLAVAAYFGWNVEKISKVFVAALANAHLYNKLAKKNTASDQKPKEGGD